jgi:hypothetical protein
MSAVDRCGYPRLPPMNWADTHAGCPDVVKARLRALLVECSEKADMEWHADDTARTSRQLGGMQWHDLLCR